MFFESYPIQYRTTNKAIRKRAAILREVDLLTDITVDENYLIMYLKFNNKSIGSKTQYEHKND